MTVAQSFEDPSERSARPSSVPGRAEFTLHRIDPDARVLRETLGIWDWTARGALARGALEPETRLRIEDGRRIAGELSRVLAGEEAGEGTDDRRVVVVARAGGRIQAVASLFVCPRAVFVELVATAPWNLLGPGDPDDARAVRGAGSAVLAHARAWSLETGRGGRVALQAENPRCLGYYERHGFARMTAEDLPYTLVPPGDAGFSAPVRRVAEGRESVEEERAPWMLLDPERRAAAGPSAVPLRTAAQAVSAAT